MTPEQFPALADLFPDAAVLVGRDGVILAANRAVHVLGHSPSGLKNRPLWEITSTPTVEVRDYLRLCMRSGQPVVGALEIIDGYGHGVACRCYGAVIRPGAVGEPQVLLRFAPRETSPNHFAVLTQKISELTEEVRRRKVAEEQQREQGERFRVTLASIGDAVITTDSVGRVTFLNPVAEDLTGWPLGDAQGRPLEDVFQIVNEHTRQPAENPVCKVLREGTIVGLANHTILISRDGTERPIDDSAAPIRNDRGQVEGVVLVFRDVSEQKASQRAVREQAEILRGILAASVDHIFVVDREGRYRFVSAGGARVLGFEPHEMIGRHWRELGLPAESMQQFDAQRDRVLRSETPIVQETMYRSADGVERHFEYVVTPIAAQNAQTEAVVTVSRDVTDRRSAEEARRESENRLRLALEAGRMGTWTWDIRTGALHCSPQLEAIHGRDPGTFPGTFEAYQSDIHPDDRATVLASIDGAIRTGHEHHIEYRLMLPDASIRWVEARATVFRDRMRQPLQMIGVCVETTERKRIEHDLRFLAQASESLATLIDHDSTMQRIASLAVPHFADWCSIDLVDHSGMLKQLAVAHVDPAKVQLAEQVRRRWPPDADAPDGIYGVFRTGQSVLVEEVSDAMVREATEDDEHFQVIDALGLKSYMCVPLAVRDNVIGVMSFVSAESGRRYTAADLALAEDLGRRAAIASENAQLYAEIREEGRKKDEFLAMLAHELRNPLAPIRSGLDVLGLMGIDSEILHTMQRQVEHLVRLVDDLLDVSRIMRGRIELRREPVELASIVDRALDTVRSLVEENDQRLSVTLPSCSVWLHADSVRMTQVIGNLLNNACKYTPSGGQIHLSAETQNEQVVIRVRDTGIGIGPDVLPHVFDLFIQDQRTIDRSQGGLGIGLTVVKSLVEMHGGTVTVRSEGPARGSEFAVRLPVLCHPGKAITSQPQPIEPSALRILVVDDNVSAANMLCRLLEKLGGHQVFTAHDGLAALAAAKEHMPHLLLLDIGLPKLNGFEVARRLREQPEFNRVRLVAITGYGTEEDRRKSLDAGFDEHLVKPPGVAALRTLLQWQPRH